MSEVGQTQKQLLMRLLDFARKDDIVLSLPHEPRYCEQSAAELNKLNDLQIVRDYF